jgi:TonB family protein
MKTTIISLLFPLLFVNGFTQNLNFEVHGIYAHPITKEKLSKARSMSDIIPCYPESWIESYNSAGITVISNGNTFSAKSSNDIFSEEQIKMLGSLDFGAEIAINIGYRYKNPVTNETENGNMHYSATVIPETEAEYSDGYEKLTQYLMKNAIEKISADDTKDLQQAVVRFTIDEGGEIADTYISKTSGNPGIDRLLLEVINDMPNWKPAADSQGIKVKQEFEFSVGNTGC